MDSNVEGLTEQKQATNRLANNMGLASIYDNDVISWSISRLVVILAYGLVR